MDGAGGFNGANYVGEIAPRDGTMLGFMGGTAWQYATEPERFRADLRNYEFIAFQPGTTVYYVRKDVAPGMKEPGDIVRATKLIAGGNGVHNARDLLIRLSLDILGVPHQYVTGYRSGQTARLALQRNEVNFYAEPASAYRGAVEAQVIQPGIAIPVYVDPIYNGESLSNSPQVDGLAIPAFQDLYRKVKGAPPSGQLWDVYLSALALTSAMGRLIALPPQAPEAAVTALRNATVRLNNDPAFAEDFDEVAWLRAELRDRARHQSFGTTNAHRPAGDAGFRRRLHQACKQIASFTSKKISRETQVCSVQVCWPLRLEFAP